MIAGYTEASFAMSEKRMQLWWNLVWACFRKSLKSWHLKAYEGSCLMCQSYIFTRAVVTVWNAYRPMLILQGNHLYTCKGRIYLSIILQRAFIKPYYWNFTIYIKNLQLSMIQAAKNITKANWGCVSYLCWVQVSAISTSHDQRPYFGLQNGNK